MNNIRKKITATFLATLMILSVLAAFVTPVGAIGTTPGERYNTFTLTPGGANIALIGQDIRMVTATDVTITGTAGTGDGLVFTAVSVGGYAIFNTSVLLPGTYRLANAAVTNHILTVGAPVLTIDTMFFGITAAVTNVEEFDVGEWMGIWCDYGAPISLTNIVEGVLVDLHLTTNIADADRGTIRLVDPAGNVHAVHGGPEWIAVVCGVGSLRDVDMTNIGAFILNTTGMTPGTWTIEVKTVAAYAQGLSMRSNVASLTIMDPVLDISATKTAVDMGERTTFTVTGVAGHEVHITTDPIGNVRVTPHTNDIGYIPPEHDSFLIKIPTDGTFEFTVSFFGDGTHIVEAKDISIIPYTDASIDIVVSAVLIPGVTPPPPPLPLPAPPALPVEPPVEPEPEQIPGFTAIFAILGLLAVVYRLRRREE